MSGPKGIAVAPLAPGIPLVPVLLIGAAAVAGTYAVVKLTEHYLEQKRLAERLRRRKDEFDELLRQLDELGESGVHLEEQASSTLERARKMVDAGKVEEAAALLDSQLGELDNCRQIAESRIRERARIIQQRSRGAHKLRASLVNARMRLEQRVAAIVTNDWPATERERLHGLLVDGLASIPLADVPEFKPGREFESALDAADTGYRRDAEKLAELEQEIQAVIDAFSKGWFKEQIGVAGLRTVSLQDFLAEASVVSAPEDPILEKLDGLMAKIAALRDTAGWNDLLRRANEIRRESDDAKRTLLYEDLVLDAGRRLKELNAVMAWQGGIEKLLEEAAPYEGTAVDEIVAELRRLHRAGRVVPIDDLTRRLKETQVSELKRLETERRRQAILESLEELGYETREGMETALVEGGKLVIRKAQEQDYAVEVVTNADLSVVQTAMVRFSDSEELTEQQRLRDIEKEEAWCADHSKILRKLDENGMTMSYKLKLAPGEHPVKIVKREHRTEAREQQRRSLGKQP